ncbi:putative ribonuclease H-like domain-containing protein [Tanacetum coccineum]
MTTAGTRAVVNTGKGKLETDLKKSRWVWRPKGNYLDHVSKDSGSFMLKKVEYVDPKGISKSFPKDNDVQDSEDVADKVGQHQMTEDEQILHDELEKMIAQEVVAKALDDATRQAFKEENRNITSQKRAAQATSTNKLSIVRSSVSTATTPYVCTASTPSGANAGESSFPNADLSFDPNMPDLEDDSDAFLNDGIFNRAYDDENMGAVADFNNMDDTINVSPIPTLRIHKDHPKDQILGDPKLAVQTSGKIQKASSAQQALVSYISKHNRTNHKDHQNCLLACFLSLEEPKNISQALQDESWVEAMQEELLQFKLQKVWILVDLPSGKKAIGTKWVFKNKRDKRIPIELGMRPFFLSDGKMVFRRIVYAKKKSGIMLVQVYVDAIIFDSTKKSICTEFEDYMHKRFQMSSMGKLTFFLGLQVKQQPDRIFISLDKYVANILKKFDYWSIRTASTPIESNKPLVKDEDGEDVDVHVYRSMIGSLMYLTASRLDIMFDVCACASLSKDFQNPFMAGSLPKTLKQSNDPPLSRGYTLGSGEDSLELKELMENCTQIVCFVRKQNREICLELILLGTTLSTVSFWETAVLSTTEEGLQAISTTIDGHEKLITEDYLRRHLNYAHDEEQQKSPSRITSSLSLSLQPTQSFPSPELIQPTHKAEETTFMPHDSPLHDVHSHGSAEGKDVHEKPSDETEVLVQKETPTKIIEEYGSGEKGEMEISTANIQVSTASPPKVKKRTQVQLSMDEVLARKMEKEERIRFNAEQEARALQEEEEERQNLEAARELQRQLDQRQEVLTQSTQSQGIDWNDPRVLRYHALKNRPVSIAQARRNIITYLMNQGGYKESYFKRMSYNDIKPIFETVWDHVNTFIPIGSEVEKDISKSSERETSKTVEEEKVEEEDENPEPVLIEKKATGIRRKTLARRRASDKQGQDSSKRQKKEKETANYEEEKDELRMWLTVVPDEEEFVDPKILHTKFPIAD